MNFHHMQRQAFGCIAVSNRAMDEIWQSVDVGTPIEIRP
jgi:L,D-peptidoglycan transpeptidase YkuD (ErfK/YbiS/YcfS/YnhG family)